MTLSYCERLGEDVYEDARCCVPGASSDKAALNTLRRHVQMNHLTRDQARSYLRNFMIFSEQRRNLLLESLLPIKKCENPQKSGDAWIEL